MNKFTVPEKTEKNKLMTETLKKVVLPSFDLLEEQIDEVEKNLSKQLWCLVI